MRRTLVGGCLISSFWVDGGVKTLPLLGRNGVRVLFAWLCLPVGRPELLRVVYSSKLVPQVLFVLLSFDSQGRFVGLFCTQVVGFVGLCKVVCPGFSE